MRFMMLVKATADSEAGTMPGPEVFEAMNRYNDELIKAGVLLAADGLHPTSEGFRVTFGTGGDTSVADGPFTGTEELLAGYWLIDVPSKEDAVAWARKVPFEPGDTLEVRRVFEVEEFPEDVLPAEVAAREQEWRAANQQRPIQG
ncbi:YciI family protein [Kitasatospora sp. NPDC054939]